MNDYKKALDYLRMLERKESLFFSNQVAPQVNCDVMQELVEKATPKKVEEKEDICDVVEYVYTRGKCPKCKSYVAYDGYDRYDYCQYCGQAIDWSEDE